MYAILSLLQNVLGSIAWLVILGSVAKGMNTGQISTLTITVLVSGVWLNFLALLLSAIIVYYAQKSEHDLPTRLRLERIRNKLERFVLTTREYSPLKWDRRRYITDPLGHLLGTKAVWPKPETDLPFEMLKPLDMSATIYSFGPMRKPLGLTKFLKEIGWQLAPHNGCDSTNFNSIISEIIRPIKHQLPDFDLWKTTSSTSEEIFDLVLEKIDFAPKENHRHHRRLYSGYSALADHLKSLNVTIRRLRPEELFGAIKNPKGSMGRQEKDLGFATIGDYVKAPDVWQPRVEAFKRSLRSTPIMAYYNSHPKREKKMKKRGRLIWFLCGTGRIHETITLGDVDTLLTALPYSVKNLPHSDYGVALSQIMTDGKHSVCDDVSGWDTKVSYTMLCMEANFLRQLANDEEHKQEIWDLYRLYAYPMVSIARKWRGKDQRVLYQLQGQVASGRRVTYSMNTITNIVVTLCRAAISQGVSEADMYQWARARLEQGHSDLYGGKVTGDDSVIVMAPRETQLYASIGGEFMNEIGMPRKGLECGESSVICRSMAEISFCSHDYTLVKFSQKDSRWMPVRSTTEIIAKASMRIWDDKDDEDSLTWARRQGSTLLVRYFHIPTIRILALAILSATPEDIVINQIDEEYNYKEFTPVVWITESDIVRAINRQIFGHKTLFPSDFRIYSLKDLVSISADLGNRYDTLSKTLGAHDSWLLQLRKIIRKSRINGRRYTDWLSLYEQPQDLNWWKTLLKDLLELIL